MSKRRNMIPLPDGMGSPFKISKIYDRPVACIVQPKVLQLHHGTENTEGNKARQGNAKSFKQRLNQLIRHLTPKSLQQDQAPNSLKIFPSRFKKRKKEKESIRLRSQCSMSQFNQSANQNKKQCIQNKKKERYLTHETFILSHEPHGSEQFTASTKMNSTQL